MKRFLIVGFSALAASTASFSAFAGPELYGKLNVSLQSEDSSVKNTESWKLQSNASRFGIKGSENVTEGLDVVYKLEYEVFVDDGEDGASTDELKQRNIYAGLQSAYGTLIAGNFDTPLKVAQGGFDQFNDLEVGDIKNIMVGEVRAKNIVMYSSPMIANLVKVNVASISGEQTQAVSGKKADDSLSDYRSYSIELGDADLKKRMFFAALAYDDNVVTDDVLRAVGQVKLSATGTTLGAIYQTSEDAKSTKTVTKAEEDAYGVSIAQQVGSAVVLKAQYLKSKTDQKTKPAGVKAVDKDGELLAFGVDYKLSKATKLFAYYAKDKDENNITKADSYNKTFGVGIDVKFGG